MFTLRRFLDRFSQPLDCKLATYKILTKTQCTFVHLAALKEYIKYEAF